MLGSLSARQIKNLRSSFQKFFYVNGHNVALESALQHKRSIVFRKKVERAIKKQISNIAKIDKISQIIGNKKKSVNQGYSILLAAMWLSFDEALSGGTETIKDYAIWSGQVGGQTALDKMIPPVQLFNLENLEIITKLTERADLIGDMIDKTTIDWISNIIDEGVISGSNSIDIVKFLQDKMSEEAIERANVITEHELAKAMNLVEMITYRRSGIFEYKWITSFDERVCEQCLANEEAGAISVGESFPTGVITPPAHIRCRCYLLPVLPEKINNVWIGS